MLFLILIKVLHTDGCWLIIVLMVLLVQSGSCEEHWASLHWLCFPTFRSVEEFNPSLWQWWYYKHV